MDAWPNGSRSGLLNSKDGADLVAGPDAYWNLPRLLSLADAPAHDSVEEHRLAAINVLLP